MMVRRLILLIFPVALLFTGCSESEHSPAQRFGESAPIVAGRLAPLTHALQLLDLREKDLRRPPVMEQDYRPLARLPLVDRLSRSPFHLQQWAEDTSKHLQQTAENGIAGLLPAAVRIINDGFGYPARGRPEALGEPPLAEAIRYLYGRYHVQPDKEVLDRIGRSGFSRSFETELARLLVALADAIPLLDRAYRGLSAEEAAFLTRRPELFFYPDGLTFNFLTAPTHTQSKIHSIAQKIDFSAVSTAAVRISVAIDAFINSVPNHSDPAAYFQAPRTPDGFRLEIPTMIGSIIISGFGDDLHTRRGALMIDLGGNDTYRLPGHTGKPPAAGLSVLIDLDGNDLHDAQNGKAVQGFGNLSVDVLVDRRGNDRYRAGDMAQGCGMFGIGVLADYDGDDVYEMGLMGQGFGLFGVGVLLDRRGRDRYTVTGLGQGTASTMGAGILCDASGRDKYLADRSRVRGQLPPDDWSHVQGAGLSVRSPDWDRQASFYGGVGFLSDGGGDDFYYSSHENCMGASYFLSVGALVDHGGNDWYVPGKGLGIGFAIHMGTAAFVDHSGNDRYLGNLLSGGAASDRSIAVMVDYSGDDIYGPGEEYARSLVMEESQKAKQHLSDKDVDDRIRERLARNAFASVRKPKAFGMLIDYRGNDRYTANVEAFGGSFGGLIPPAEPQNWSNAILFDLGGRDIYSHPGKKNNHYHKSMGHALCYDTEWISEIGRQTASDAGEKSRSAQTQLAAAVKSPISRDAITLANPDVFRRFAARGRIVEQVDPAVVEGLLQTLKSSEDEALNREILEVVDALLFAGKMPGDVRQPLITMLDGADPQVRIFSAVRLGGWQIRSSLRALLEKGKDPDEAARRQIVRAVGRISTGNAVDFLLTVAGGDPSPDCRREALLAISRWAASTRSFQPETEEKIIDAALKALADDDEVMRTAAAGALACCGGRPPPHEALNRALADESVYVRRAAAKSLIYSGFKAGIPALIETLRFPSIDTQQYYDRELAVDLAYFCGVDFPAERRYAYDTWKNWWDENREKIDLPLNLQIRRQIERAFAEQKEEGGIAIFEGLRNRYPHSAVIHNRYVQYCSQWIQLRLLTRKDLDRQTFLRCLRLQQILTRLQPTDADRWETLAYFQYRLGNIGHALVSMESALEIEPDNRAYREKRDAYRQLLPSANPQAKPQSS